MESRKEKRLTEVITYALCCFAFGFPSAYPTPTPSDRSGLQFYAMRSSSMQGDGYGSLEYSGVYLCTVDQSFSTSPLRLLPS